MKFLYFALLAQAALAQSADGRVPEKLVASYTDSLASPVFAAASQSPVVYTRAARPAPEQKTASDSQQYVAQPAAPAAQQFYQAQPQAVAYSQPAVAGRYVNAQGVQKIAFAPQQQIQRRPQQYSSAADVSSFSYTSPVVAYSNLGVLRPIGRPQQQAQPIVQAAATSYSSSPAVVQYASPSSYSTAPQGYDGGYQAVAQKSAYSDVQQPQASNYPTSPVNQKIIYQAVPAYEVQGAQKAASQVAFAPSQQYTYQTQAAAPQNYEAAHSIPQVVYAQPAQPQYYSAAAQAKFANSDIIYGH